MQRRATTAACIAGAASHRESKKRLSWEGNDACARSEKATRVKLSFQVPLQFN
jgi:hypothetical protein